MFSRALPRLAQLPSQPSDSVSLLCRTDAPSPAPGTSCRRAVQTTRATAQATSRPDAQLQPQPRAWRRCSVAVIGAGAAGLVAARELLREGHAVRVFEQGSAVGGVWQYTDEVESEDLLGRDPARPKKVHSSMYRHLRTNLPREIMGYTDFPFTPKMLGPDRSVDSRRFCSHTEVLRYLQAFCDYFDLKRLINFNVCVERVMPVSDPSTAGDRVELMAAGPGPGSGPGPGPAQTAGAVQASGLPVRWRVQSRNVAAGAAGGGTLMEDDFDAVVVCNGHYSAPKVPDVAGSCSFPGLQLHSHNYRDPQPFKGQVVLVVGASNSGDDISREVADVAAAVYVSARTWKEEPLAQAYGGRANMFRYPMVSRLTEQGCAIFPAPSAASSPAASSAPSLDSVCLPVDAVIYATGYRYTFPFLLDTQQQQQEEQSNGHSQQEPALHQSCLVSDPSPAAAAAAAGGGGARPLDPPPVGRVLGVEEQRVGPLYLHMFPPSLAPGLSFLGLPWKVVPFPQAELQAKLVSRVLSGRSVLPDERCMQEAVQRMYDGLQQRGVPARYTHMQGQEQWQYNDELAAMCGTDVDSTPHWRVLMYTETGLIRRSCPDTFRDGPFCPQDEEAMQQAHRILDEQAEELWRRQPQWSNSGSSGGGAAKERVHDVSRTSQLSSL